MTTKIAKRRYDIYFEQIRDFVHERWSWFGITLAYLIGVFVNALSDPAVATPGDVVIRLFDVRTRPVSWLNIVAACVLISFPFLKVALDKYLQGRNYAIRLSEVYASKVDSVILPYQKGRIAWGPELVLQASPDLHYGWRLNQVELIHESVRYSMPDVWAASYETFMRESRAQGKFRDDKPLLMIRKNPDVFSDRPTLVIFLQEVLYSQTQFFKNNIAVLFAQRHRYISEVLEGKIDFPNSLCLHMVVVTSDGYLLVTQRTEKVDVFKSLWSCSVEEQLDLVDFNGNPKDFSLNWCKRLLREEIGVDEDGYDTTNMRLLAVFLEGDVLNINVAGFVVLRHNRKTLEAIIDKHPRTDYEFQKWDFMKWEDIPKELIYPSRAYHPSSGLRMFLVGILKYGAVGLGRRIDAIVDAKVT